MREWLSGRASPCQGERREFESRLPLHNLCAKDALLMRLLLHNMHGGYIINKMDLIFWVVLFMTCIKNISQHIDVLSVLIRRHSQVVRQRSAKPLFPSSSLGGASS